MTKDKVIIGLVGSRSNTQHAKDNVVKKPIVPCPLPPKPS
jgi:hypothetical protein